MKQSDLARVVHAFVFPALVLALHLFLARNTNYYGRFPWADIPMHFMGGVAVTYGFNVLLGDQFLGKAQNRIYYLFSLFAFGVMMAVFWEFAEYMQDRLWGSNMQVSIRNTMKDLFFGALGSAVFTALLALRVNESDLNRSRHGK